MPIMPSTFLPSLLLFLLLTAAHALRSYPVIKSTGDVFGRPPYLSVSYYYPLNPAEDIKHAFRMGDWPAKLPIRPFSIYECMPPADTGLQPRTYTCKNHEIADDKKTPEGIRDYEEARARAFDGSAPGVCDANTGLATTTLHWGIWQHNCFSSSAAFAEHSETLETNYKNSTTVPDGVAQVASQHITWNVDGLFWRRHVLLQLAAHNYALNCRLREQWKNKNLDLKEMGKEVNKHKFTAKQRERNLNMREARFWRESFSARELGREAEKLVSVYFEQRMRGKGEGFGWFGMGDVEVNAD